jgi:hypothetical protein
MGQKVLGFNEEIWGFRPHAINWGCKNRFFDVKYCIYRQITEKGKAAERQRRKATGAKALVTLGQPVAGFFFSHPSAGSG